MKVYICKGAVFERGFIIVIIQGDAYIIKMMMTLQPFYRIVIANSFLGRAMLHLSDPKIMNIILEIKI